ncbi:MAG: hypothetical protein Q7S22_02505 [Candidatus Micrarchaeota archaeon]|nr:hypothetical protein [Candidatus Micrarchaeota archaeon]
MVELRRSIKCSNCGSETSLYLTSELALSELLIHGRCQKCGNSLQINFSMVDPSQPAQQSSSSSSSETPMINIDQSLFEPEITSESIKDLIEET